MLHEPHPPTPEPEPKATGSHPPTKARKAATCYLLTLPATPGYDSAKVEGLVAKLADRLGCEAEDVFVLPAGVTLTALPGITPKPPAEAKKDESAAPEAKP